MAAAVTRWGAFNTLTVKTTGLLAAAPVQDECGAFWLPRVTVIDVPVS